MLSDGAEPVDQLRSDYRCSSSISGGFCLERPPPCGRRPWSHPGPGVLLDLAAIWHQDLHLKVLKIILEQHMLRFTMEMLILQTSDDQMAE